MRLALLFILWSISAKAGFSHEIILKSLSIYHPYLLIDENRDGYGFLSIENEGSESEYLMQIQSNFSSKSSVRIFGDEGKKFYEVDLSQGLEIPAGEAIHFEPKELELLFTEIFHDLNWYEPHTAVFIFKNSGSIELEFEVEVP